MAKKCIGVTSNPSGHLLVLSHSMSWGLLSSVQFDSVNPRDAVEEPLIDWTAAMGSRKKVRPGMISEADICS